MEQPSKHIAISWTKGVEMKGQSDQSLPSRPEACYNVHILNTKVERTLCYILSQHP